MPTGIVYDETMSEHTCLWDPNHNEKPERFLKTLERCQELDLLARCLRISSRKATNDELEKLHSSSMIEKLKSTADIKDTSVLEEISSNYDFLYIHPSTYNLSLLAAGSSIELVTNILKGNVKNGMAIIRPPGHHAMKAEYCGYCFFNNVALAAQEALDNWGIKRILIVDWDIHHGQATQQMFYDDPRVLYFSIHGYQNGAFWPHLRESDFHYIGRGAGLGYNVNVPLNRVGMGNQDYLAIFQQLLLPIAYEYNPELILVSAGFDAAIGCPEGEMMVTPACYSHFTSSLMGLAGGKIAVFLEGGYCLKSLAESAAMTLRTLLGDPCPSIDALQEPCTSVKESILSVAYVLRKHWRCLDHFETFDAISRNPTIESIEEFWPKLSFVGSDEKPSKYPTRGICPVQDPKLAKDLDNQIDALIRRTSLNIPLHKVGIYYQVDSLELENYKLKNECCFLRGIQADEESPTPSKLIDLIFDGASRSGVIVVSNILNAVVEVVRHSTEKRKASRVLLIDARNQRDSSFNNFIQDSRVLCFTLFSSEVNTADEISDPSFINVDLPQNIDDTSLLAMFFWFLLPIAYQFNPQLVIFVTNSNSPGGTHNLSQVIHQLKSLADGHLVVVTEDYQFVDTNTDLSSTLRVSVETLLGNPHHTPSSPVEEHRLVIRKTIQELVRSHQSHWASLAFNVKLPKQNILASRYVDHIKFNPEIVNL